MRNLRLLFILPFFITSCIEEYDLNFNNSEPRLVVEGLVTNKSGPYYVRLTKSNIGVHTTADYSFTDNAEPVMNALVIISDDLGLADTLLPIDVILSEYNFNPLLGYFKLINDDFGNVIDTLFLQDPPEYRHERGFYKTTKLVGISGHTYTLHVTAEGKTYDATAYMPPVPEIDSVGYIKKISEKDGQEYYIPLLFFADPQGISNFYLIQLITEEASRSMSAKTLWQFSILSDAFLEPYVKGLNIQLGISPNDIQYPLLWEGDSIYVALSSLSETAYDFYEVLLDQFKNDGGVYKQVPASPPTNISNGGLGLFRASAVVEGRIIIK